MKTILINGAAGAGKNHVANLLKQSLIGCGYRPQILAFATTLKEIIAATCGISLEDLEFYKNQPDQPIITIKRRDVSQSTSVLNMRQVLQRFGTEAMRSLFGNYVWVDRFKEQAHLLAERGVDFLICPDFRFSEEFILSALTIKVLNNDLDSNNKHSSENDLEHFNFDYTIDNTGRPELKEKVKEVVKWILRDF